jgi:hypothetical protein
MSKTYFNPIKQKHRVPPATKRGATFSYIRVRV